MLLAFALAAATALGNGPKDWPVLEGAKLARVPGPMNVRLRDEAPGLTPRGDLQVRIRHSARHSPSIPAVSLPSHSCVIHDRVGDVGGWKAYRAEVLPQKSLKVRLRGDHEAWFRIRTVNRWGQLEEGMLRNLIPTGNPEASYKNPKAVPNEVFFIVDTTELGAEAEDYRLEVAAEN